LESNCAEALKSLNSSSQSWGERAKARRNSRRKCRVDIRNRLAMVLNRANSGIATGDIERVVSMPALAKVRSAGMIFVKAANSGKSAVEQFPASKVVADLELLAGKLISTADSRNQPAPPVQSTGMRGFFGRLTGQTPLQRLPIRSR